MSWQSIESAPVDGTKVILGAPGVVLGGCYWQEMKKRPNRWEWGGKKVDFVPTHWMPQPEAPEGEVGYNTPIEE